jgi:hypothetical protein
LDSSAQLEAAVLQPGWKMYRRALLKKDSRLILKKVFSFDE